MRIQPNHATLEGEILRITRSADGYGADVDLRVSANLSADSPDDFTGAAAGQTLKVFSALPEALRRGARYRVRATVLGGPRGERVVLEEVDEIGL